MQMILKYQEILMFIISQKKQINTIFFFFFVKQIAKHDKRYNSQAGKE